MTDDEWAIVLRRMDEHAAHIAAWEPAEPDPNALRCVHSRHRTLAHLRACQETWLSACLAYEGRSNKPRLKMPRPWRLFELRDYAALPWDEHHSAFLADRARWRSLLVSADRRCGGKINGGEFTIESLTERLVAHEHHHLYKLWQIQAQAQEERQDRWLFHRPG